MSLLGDDTLGGNSDHLRFREFIAGEQCDNDELEYFNQTLDYCYNTMTEATEYALFLDLNIRDIQCFNVETWFEHGADLSASAIVEFRRVSGVRHIASKTLTAIISRSRYQPILQLIFSSNLFDLATRGAAYIKPRQYLAIALAESDLDMDQIRDGITMLLRFKSARYMDLADTDHGREVRNNREVVRHRDIFHTTIEKLRNRL
ncbi:uncharacterized protein BP5553_00191 [Venustampulla echinocandica]|uniref:Uncharacterized protein n=1 Tax=Venustampulla echinocandica TaxID=2656787 RepID=A0A370TXG6_9HELO|nr:uncharacterized protein BP5553_00191 [Venustampulla echinocandica]RDL40212.1 hypothetical protein BP5553_00191 [Venustampulla echinocandica]